MAATDYKQSLNDLIKKQMTILGPSVALGLARKVPGLQITDQGQVISISGDPLDKINQLANIILKFTGQSAQLSLKSVLKSSQNLEKNP